MAGEESQSKEPDASKASIEAFLASVASKPSFFKYSDNRTCKEAALEVKQLRSQVEVVKKLHQVEGKIRRGPLKECLKQVAATASWPKMEGGVLNDWTDGAHMYTTTGKNQQQTANSQQP